MTWLSRLRRTLVASRWFALARADVVQPGTPAEPRTNTEPSSTFGYGALVIGNSHPGAHRAR